MRLAIPSGVRNGGDKLCSEGRAFVEAMTALTGEPIELITSRDYRQLLNDLLAGYLTIAWLPPMLHKPAFERGAKLVATCERRGALTYRAVLLVNAESGFRSPTSLRRSRFAWTDPQSAAGHCFPKMMLESLGFKAQPDFGYERFYGSALAAARAVVDREADVCACYVSDSDNADVTAELTAILGHLAPQLRVVATTESIPCDALVAAPCVDEPMMAKLHAAINEMASSPIRRAATMRLFGTDVLRIG